MSRMSDLNYLERSDPQQARRAMRLAAERYQAHIDLQEAAIRFGANPSSESAHGQLLMAATAYADAVQKEQRHG